MDASGEVQGSVSCLEEPGIKPLTFLLVEYLLCVLCVFWSSQSLCSDSQIPTMH